MFENLPVKDILKRISRHKRGYKARGIVHAYRDWYISIFLAVIIFVSVAGWGAMVYVSYETSFGGGATESVSVPYKRDVVDAALTEYRKRKVEFEEQENTPSLPPAETTRADTQTEAEVTEVENEAQSSSDVMVLP
jgi:hypothetical protein